MNGNWQYVARRAGSAVMRAIVLAVLTIMLLVPSIVAAEPVERVAGPYRLTLEYANEPPYLEATAVLVLRVSDVTTGAPVAGLERTIRFEGAVEVTEDVVRAFPVFVRPILGQPGAYEAVFIPPAIGEYRFRLLGEIEGLAVDEVFTSGAGGLPEVQVAENDYTSQGALIAYAILSAYLLGMAVLGVVLLVRSRRSRGAARADAKA